MILEFLIYRWYALYCEFKLQIQLLFTITQLTGGAQVIQGDHFSLVKTALKSDLKWGVG